jgi:hypothetical protein
MPKHSAPSLLRRRAAVPGFLYAKISSKSKPFEEKNKRNGEKGREIHNFLLPYAPSR